MKKIIIVGSGSDKTLRQNSNNDYVYCNTSFLRAKKKKLIKILVLSESIIGDNKNVFNKNINTYKLDNLENKELNINKIRKYKQQSFKGISCEKIILYTNEKNKTKLKNRLKKLGINFKVIYFISDMQIFIMLIKFVNSKRIINIILFNKLLFFKSILKFLIQKKLPNQLKPSTGGAAVLWFRREYPKHKIIIDGIGKDNHVYYPIKKKLKKIKFNLAHRMIDKIIIKSIINN